MIAGGLETGSSLCRPVEKELLAVADYNRDGVRDELFRYVYADEDCKRGQSDVYLKLGVQKGEPVVLGRTHLGHYNQDFYHFSVHFWNYNKFLAEPSQGAKPFRFYDLVETPFGPRDEKLRGRIDSFIIEVDPNNPTWSRTIAEVHTPYGWDAFELSALTLLSSINELDAKADALIHRFKDSENIHRREAILQFARFDCLKPKFQEEVRAIETRLALAFEKNIAGLDLDPEGKRILLDKVGEKLGFQRRASTLAWEAREKERAVPTNVR